MSLRAERSDWAYLLWGAVGALAGFGVVGILTIGIFVLAAALLLAVVGVVLPSSRSSAIVATIPGLGIMPMAVGLANLGGPGERCSSSAVSSSCTELLSPWPFLVPGLMLLIGGSWLIWRVRATGTGPTV